MIYNSLKEIADNFDVFLFDAYGVFWAGNGFYAGSREMMAELVKQGKFVAVISNTSGIREDLITSYNKKGLIFGQDYCEFVAAGDLLKKTLAEGCLKFASNPKPRKYFVIGDPHSCAFNNTVYEQVEDIDKADFVYCGVPHVYEDSLKKYPQLSDKFLPVKCDENGNIRMWDTTDFTPFIEQVKMVAAKKLPALNANPDFVAKEGHPLSNTSTAEFVVRNGMIAEALRQRGCEVLEYGKPHLNIYEHTFAILRNRGIKINKERMCMIGDTIRTDIKGGINAGITPVLCVKTGVTAEEISKGNSIKNLCIKENIEIQQIIQIKSVGEK